MTALAISNQKIYCGTGTDQLRLHLKQVDALFNDYSDLNIAAFPNTIYHYISKLLQPSTLQQLRHPSNNPREWFIELQRHAEPIKDNAALEKDFTFKPIQAINKLSIRSEKMTEEKQPQRKHIAKSTTIKKLIDVNPRREGSHGHRSWEVIKNGMDVAAYLELGGRMNDLLWEFKKKHVDLV